MTEVRKSGTVYTCRRCLKQPNETYRPDKREVMATCSECGTENWCLPAKVKTKEKAKKASEVTEREVAESNVDTGTETQEKEQETAAVEKDKPLDSENTMEAEQDTTVESSKGRESDLEAEPPEPSEIAPLIEPISLDSASEEIMDRIEEIVAEEGVENAEETFEPSKESMQSEIDALREQENKTLTEKEILEAEIADLKAKLEKA